jgi:hypothetical protein
LYFCKVQFTTGCGAEKKDKVRNLEQLYENEKYRIEITSAHHFNSLFFILMFLSKNVTALADELHEILVRY